MPLDCTAGYIRGDAVGDKALKRMPQIRLKFIDVSNSSYRSNLNSPNQLEQIRQAKKLASVLCDLESNYTREKEDKNKRAMEAEGNRRQKSEEKQVRENEDRLRGVDSCEALVCSVLTFGMDHIYNLKVKWLWVRCVFAITLGQKD